MLGGKMFVLGGEEGWDRYHDTIESYNPTSDTWTVPREPRSPHPVPMEPRSPHPVLRKPRSPHPVQSIQLL